MVAEPELDLLLRDYHLLTRAAGWVELPHWTRLEMTGRDRVTFLHGMCTNDIRGLQAGAGCEAFVTNVQGKTVGHIFVFHASDHFDIVSAPGQAETLLKHWERYIIREDVQLHDLSSARTLVVVAGAQAADRLRPWVETTTPAKRLDHVRVDLAGVPGMARRLDGPPLFLLDVAAHDAEHMRDTLRTAAIPACRLEAWEMLRGELGLPVFGVDMDADNLPQEVGRDRWAISFAKGCYLGQETVARIDALGHVNRRLTGLRLFGTGWHPGRQLQEGDKTIARLTSVCHSPVLDGLLALAYVRRGSEAPGTRWTGQAGQAAEVVELPVFRAGPSPASW